MSDISGFSSKMFVAMFVRKDEMIIPVKIDIIQPMSEINPVYVTRISAKFKN